MPTANALLGEGVYLSPSDRESNFLSAAHTDADIAKTLKVFNAVFNNIGRQ